MWWGRVVAALSLAAALVLLLASLQQESPLRPTPLAVRRPPPLDQHASHAEVHAPHAEVHAPHTEVHSSHAEVHASHAEVSVVYNEVQAGEIAPGTDTSVGKADDVLPSEPRADEREKAAADSRLSEPSSSRVQSDVIGSRPREPSSSRVQSDVIGSRPREPSSSVVQSDVIGNATRARAKLDAVPEQGAAAEAGAVHTRSLYVGAHAWSSAATCRALGARTRVLVLVTSAPPHRAQRAAVRLTWGSHSRGDVALAFVLGLPPDNLTAELREERDLYGDIIMGNFVDSYKNLTLKTISMLEWTFTYCPLVPRLLKTDDDMFINIPRLLQFLDARVNQTATIWGRVVRRWLPNRNPHSKYYLSKAQFPAKWLPTFATGPAYVVTRDAVRPLWDAALARDATFLSLEDVAITGVAARRAKVRLVNAGEFVNRHVRPSACALRRLVAVHMVSRDAQFDLWRSLHAGHCKD